MTTVLYGMVTDPKYLDMARAEAFASSCVVCRRRGAVERAGMSWCGEHSTPLPFDQGSSYSQGDATARWHAWVAMSSATTTTGGAR
jgi:hypothetical protein